MSPVTNISLGLLLAASSAVAYNPYGSNKGRYGHSHSSRKASSAPVAATTADAVATAPYGFNNGSVPSGAAGYAYPSGTGVSSAVESDSTSTTTLTLTSTILSTTTVEPVEGNGSGLPGTGSGDDATCGGVVTVTVTASTVTVTAGVEADDATTTATESDDDQGAYTSTSEETAAPIVAATTTATSSQPVAATDVYAGISSQAAITETGAVSVPANTLPADTEAPVTTSAVSTPGAVDSTSAVDVGVKDITSAPAAPVTSDETSAPAYTTSAEATTAEPSSATPAPSAPVTGYGSKSKRGCCYNDASACGSLGDASWGWNWDSTPGNLRAGITYIPQMWGTKDPNHMNNWAANAQKAIANGADAVLSINEPDNSGQADLTPAGALPVHQALSKNINVAIGSPAVTSDNSTMKGLNWLREFKSIGGKWDFTTVHYYNECNEDPVSQKNQIQYFKDWMADAATFGKDIWLTEFACSDPTTTPAREQALLKWIMPLLESNPQVVRHSFFKAEKIQTGGYGSSY